MTEDESGKFQPKSLPWYKEGLRFGCTECGKCCTGTRGFIWISEEEIVSISKLLGISEELFKRRYTRKRNNRYALADMKSRNHDCVFLSGKKCTIYEARPKQCRTFPWWKENLNTKESWESAAQNCEGINDQAPVVPYDKILEQLSLNET